MKRAIIILCLMMLLLPGRSSARVRFGVGLNFIGNSGMGMGFDVGVGWQKWGFDLAHYGVQEETHAFGSVGVASNLYGVYYKVTDFFILKTGMHTLQLNVDTTKDILGTRESVIWSGPYAVLEFPITFEELYFIKPFWGVLSVDDGRRTEVSWGISLGAEFDPGKDFIKLID